MKICKVCLNNNILCSACNTKLKNKEITKLDVLVSKSIKKSKIKADFLNTLETKDTILILSDKENSSRLIGKGGVNAKKLKKITNKKIIIIDNSNNKTIAESVLNSSIIGINILFAKQEKYRIRINKNNIKNIKKNMIKILEKILNKKVEISYE